MPLLCICNNGSLGAPASGAAGAGHTHPSSVLTLQWSHTCRGPCWPWSREGECQHTVSQSRGSAGKQASPSPGASDFLPLPDLLLPWSHRGGKSGDRQGAATTLQMLGQPLQALSCGSGPAPLAAPPPGRTGLSASARLSTYSLIFRTSRGCQTRVCSNGLYFVLLELPFFFLIYAQRNAHLEAF